MPAFVRQILVSVFTSLTLAAIVLTIQHQAQAKDIKPANAKTSEAKLPTLNLSAGGQTIKAEIVANDATRQKGLMFRTQMGKNDGMLFVFPELGYHAMWMRNTLIPLSVAYMDDSGKILSIHEMQPQSDTTHQSAGPARYALEMNANWFSTHKVAAGDVIKGIEKAPKPE
jgi:uncharacterized protein